MNAHTFTLPPFFVTSGSHYLTYRPGSNVLNSLSRSRALHLSRNIRTHFCYTHTWAPKHMSGKTFSHAFLDVDIYYNPRVPYTRVDSSVDTKSRVF